MDKQQITRFWHRRSSEAILLITGFIISFFLWSRYGNLTDISAPLVIDLIPGAMAVATFLIVLISYFAVPIQQLRPSTYLNYLLSLVAVVVLITTTSGLHSVYLPLFFVLLTFSSLLGPSGTATGIFLLAGFIAYHYFTSGMDPNDTIVPLIVGGLTILVSFLLWSRINTASDDKGLKSDISYQALANQLSHVAGQSEIVISAIGDGVISLNPHGVVQLINPAAERLLGWPSHDALNLNYKTVFKMLDSREHEIDSNNDPIVQAISQNTIVKNDNFSLKTQSGKSFMASISVSPVGKAGQGVIVVFRDITNEKTDERQRAEFISTASHEMRTPVASIEGYLGLVLNPKTATIDDKAREYIKKAHESAEHLGRLFADLLDVSKADDSRLKNDPKAVDVTKFIHDIVEGLTPKGNEKGLNMVFKPSTSGSSLSDRRLAPVLYANVDNDHLREIVQNLVENAIKYTLQGGVTVDVTGDEHSITISIADTGIGIPHEDQSHLFQKFYRIDTSETREIGGTGLGLYLCRRLTETIGGQIWVESAYQQGSTFFVKIPRIEHADAERLLKQQEADKLAEAKKMQELANRQPTVAEIQAMPTIAPTAAAQPTQAARSIPVTLAPEQPASTAPAPAAPVTKIPIQAEPAQTTPAPTPATATPTPPVTTPAPAASPAPAQTAPAVSAAPTPTPAPAKIKANPNPNQPPASTTQATETAPAATAQVEPQPDRNPQLITPTRG